MGDRYGRSDINEITIGMSIWDMGYRFGTRYIDMVIYHIDMVILDIDMGYGLLICEMTESIWSSWRSIWDILSPCLRDPPHEPQLHRFLVLCEPDEYGPAELRSSDEGGKWRSGFA